MHWGPNTLGQQIELADFFLASKTQNRLELSSLVFSAHPDLPNHLLQVIDVFAVLLQEQIRQVCPHQQIVQPVSIPIRFGLDENICESSQRSDYVRQTFRGKSMAKIQRQFVKRFVCFARCWGIALRLVRRPLLFMPDKENGRIRCIVK